MGAARVHRILPVAAFALAALLLMPASSARAGTTGVGGIEMYVDGHCRVTRTWFRDGSHGERRECSAAALDESASRSSAERAPPALQPAPAEPPAVVTTRPQAARGLHRCVNRSVAMLIGTIASARRPQYANDDGTVAPSARGAIAGKLVGGRVGELMGASAQACIGQALEFAVAGQRLMWRDQRSSVQPAQGAQPARPDQGTNGRVSPVEPRVEGAQRTATRGSKVVRAAAVAQTLDGAPAGESPGPEYAVVPGARVDTPWGPCRSFEAEVSVGEMRTRALGTACRRDDGAWERASLPAGRSG